MQGHKPLLLPLKMEEGAISQRMQVAWQRQGKGLCPRAYSKNYSPADTLSLSSEIRVGLQNYKMINVCCFLVTKLVVICYNNNRKQNREGLPTWKCEQMPRGIRENGKFQ